ncbi:MAG TPA: HEAT repeat domain-containing protein, partial [Sandaracinaceae bacterium LLY-WYZ-13_1]|nr:HEAT repeat domain-containing protein [Sandaracinaceae bacterium LLY-WYZ-13_1]
MRSPLVPRVALAVFATLAVVPVARAQRSWAEHLVGPRARAALEDADAERRLAAVERLAVRGEPRQAVAALLDRLEEEEDVRVRRAIFHALARRGDRSAVGPLAQRLADWGREDRATVLRTLGALGGEEAVRVLVEWLGAADVGDQAVDALVAVGAPAVPHLIRALEVPASAPRAARALGRIGDARGAEPLLGALQGALPAARGVILEALAAIGDARATPSVLAMLEDPSPTVVAAALAALGRLAGPAAAAPVATLADRGPPEQRAPALRALAALDPEAAGPRARAILDDDEAPAVLRRAAVEGLLAHPAAATVSVLAAMLDDPAHRVAAAEAMARAPRGAGVPALLPRAREDATRSLDPALGLAIRRHAAHLDDDVLEAARAHLRGDPSPRGATLAALARDETVLPRLEQGLGAPSPEARAAAALGVRLLGRSARGLRARVAARLVDEADPRAFRALALAALALGARIDP